MLPKNPRSHNEEYNAIEENLSRVVVNRSYSTDCLAHIITERPLIVFMLILIPISIFLITLFVGSISVDYTVEEFQLRPDIEVRASADIYAETLDSHVSRLSGASHLQNLINTQNPRSKVRGTLRMLSVLDLSRLQNFCKVNKFSCDEMDSILHPSNLHYITSLERNIAALESFSEVCFTNALEYGQVNDDLPDCVPPTGLLQYVLPRWNETEEKWHMDGRGNEMQVNYLSRVFMNPNYGFFFDANFSTLHQKVHQVRTEFTLASSPNQTLQDYKQKMRNFIRDALWYVKKNADHQFIWTLIGGDLVESLKAEAQIFGEYIRLLFVSFFCILLCWLYSGSIVIGLYSIVQLVVTQAAACGVYVIFYDKLTIVSFSAFVWVMTFCLHGTLGFYDTFVYSGVMPTKSQRNDLSLEQRIAFTMRRVTVSVCVSNIIAIILFLINFDSVSDSLRHFSVFMTIVLLWNMHFIIFITPAFFTLYHYYISHRGHDLQTRVNLLNEKTKSCKRILCMSGLLKAIQPKRMIKRTTSNPNKNWFPIGTKTSNNNRDNHNYYDHLCFHAKSKKPWPTFLDKMRAIKEDLYGMFYMVYSKVCRTIMRRKQEVPNKIVPENMFPIDDFASIERNVDSQVGTKSQYYNRRMLLDADVVHVPCEFTERSKKCWRGISTVMTQHETVEEPCVPPLPKCGHYTSSDVRASMRSWGAVGEALGLETHVLSKVNDLLPMVARSVVRAQDTRYIILNSGGVDSNDMKGESLEEYDSTEYMNRMHLFTRWFCSLIKCCGKSNKNHQNTENSQKMPLKGRRRWQIDTNMRYQRPFTFSEHFIIRIYVPFLHNIRWFMLVVFLFLFVAAIVFGLHIDVAGLPTTLVNDPKGPLLTFAKQDDTFGHRGKCTFCGPYYLSTDIYRTANKTDIDLCKTKYKEPQMNVYVDGCDVCGGDDECIDCANIPRGPHVLQCGGCELPTESSCTPSKAQSGPYCEWRWNKKNFFGYNCSVECNSTTCGPNGVCDVYTGVCVCKEGFAGSKCDECAGWLLHIKSNPLCTLECDAKKDSKACACNLKTGKCTGCPKGYRGYGCNYSKHDCGLRRVYDPVKDTCECGANWIGPTCNVSEQCNMRGAWVDMMESPTMRSMCICVGHWRGSNCQLCDCLNGGMCDSETGKCICVGAFVGERCQTCSADCTRHGKCPIVPNSALNVRTLIYNKGIQRNMDSDLPFIKDIPKLASSKTCSQYMTQSSCNMHPECWWVSNLCFSAYFDHGPPNASDCICLNSLFWSLNNCSTCLAPPGATCVGNDKMRGCNGQLYTFPAHTMSMDQCGVCGGDGKCRGCDGIPNSGTVYDNCGVCGGNNDCDTEQDIHPFFINYLIDFTGVTNIAELNMTKYILPFCTAVRGQFMHTKIAPCFMEDYLRSVGHKDTVESLEDVYNYAVINGRMAEVIFKIDSNFKPKALTHMIYRLSLLSVRTAYASKESNSYVNFANPKSVFHLYNVLQKQVTDVLRPMLSEVNTSVLLTSLPFQSAFFFVYSTRGLWVTVTIGVIVCFLAFLILSVSLTIALGGAMTVTMVGFGTLVMCNLFNWKLDTVLQMCLSSTIPISMEYVVHITGEYTDYLQLSTSNLFALEVSRRTALTASLLQSFPSFFTSLLAVLGTSLIFSTSSLIPSRRSGQVCAAMHIVLIIAVTLFSGALLAVGPKKSFKHWTVLVALAFPIFPLCIGVVVLCYNHKSHF
ncbi:unnamed protein product [Phytomonas sp. Hart1]|nr:unnamed protein product [Phytomonas sp. Hart1]|eukprot:CCW68598.1 unnamed protein product [Phytomonas sp. isolate Hart1]